MLYTSPERVVRDGRVVAFAGEVMAMAEARRRGLVEDEVPAPVEAVEDAPADDAVEPDETEEPEAAEVEEPAPEADRPKGGKRGRR